MVGLLVLLLLLAVPPNAITTTAANVYYVTANNATAESCPPNQICYNLSYYISQSNHYFTSDTTIIFLEGEHSYNKTKNSVTHVHNLTLKGQGQWPVAGAEETVMQSTVIINCTRGRGAFLFANSYNITVEGLTVVNCGGISFAVFYFSTVQSLIFRKNSIQHMTGYGIFVHNCGNAIITNCSYYHSRFNITHTPFEVGGGVGIRYRRFANSSTSYTLKLSHSNMTKCCNQYIGGGGIFLQTKAEVGLPRLLFSHLVMTKNRGRFGGGLFANLNGDGRVTIVISNCVFVHGSALYAGGGIFFTGITITSDITIENTNLTENDGPDTSELCLSVGIAESNFLTLSLLNSAIMHTENFSNYGVLISGCCASVKLINTSMKFANLHLTGFSRMGSAAHQPSKLQMIGCQIEGSHNVPTLFYLFQTETVIANCRFSNNTSNAQDKSVI